MYDIFGIWAVTFQTFLGERLAMVHQRIMISIASGLDTNSCPIAGAICSILHFNDCHNWQCMSVASRASDNCGGGGGGGGGKYPK